MKYCCDGAPDAPFIIDGLGGGCVVVCVFVPGA